MLRIFFLPFYIDLLSVYALLSNGLVLPILVLYMLMYVVYIHDITYMYVCI